MKSKPKAENLTVIKTCLTTARQRDITKKKKAPIKKPQILSNILHHFSNDIIVQVDNGNTETSVEVKSLKQKVKKFHLLQKYFMVRHSLIFLEPVYNLISESRGHLMFKVRLSFYVLFLGLIFTNDLLSPKLNHEFSGENTTFSKMS